MSWVTGAMLSHRRNFSRLGRSLKYLPYMNQLFIVVPRGERRSLQRILTFRVGTGPQEIQIVEHDVEQTTPEGLVRYGHLKTFLMEVLLSRLRSSSIGLLMDDDIAQTPRGVGRDFKTHMLTTDQIHQRVKQAGHAARSRGSFFFTFASQGMSNNSILVQGGFTPVVKWSGILGVLPGAPICFDPTFNGCEDWDAAGRILCDMNQRVIADATTVVHMRFEASKYQLGGSLYDDRVTAMTRIADKYLFKGEPLFHIRNSALGVPSLACSRRIIKQLREEAA